MYDIFYITPIAQKLNHSRTIPPSPFPGRTTFTGVPKIEKYQALYSSPAEHFFTDPQAAETWIRQWGK